MNETSELIQTSRSLRRRTAEATSTMPFFRTSLQHATQATYVG